MTAGTWQTNSIKTATSLGFKVFAVDANPDAEGFDYADQSLCCDIFDTRKVISKCIDLNIIPNGVSSFTSEAGMIPAAQLRDHYNLKGIRSGDINSFVDKSTQRAIWEKHGLPNPVWAAASTFDEAIKSIAAFSFPLIVKPVDSAGSRGITTIENGQALTPEIFDQAMQYSKAKKVVIEEFIKGIEYTAEAFADNGEILIVALTEKKKVEGTNNTVAVELASPQNNIELMELAASVLRDAFFSIGLRDGPGHAEFIISNEGKIYLVEAAGRGGGFMIFDGLVPSISGFDIAKATVLNACGHPVDSIKSQRFVRPKAAILRYIPSEKGTLKSFSGFDEANSIEGVQAKPFVEINSKLNAAMTDGDRMGYILAAGDGITDTQLKLDRARQMITFQVSPDDDH